MKFIAALIATSLALSAIAVSQTVEAWQKAAVRKYPALGKPGSPLNEKFLAIIAEKKTSEPAYFQRIDWPMRAADAAMKAVRDDEAAAKEKAKADAEAAAMRAKSDQRQAAMDEAKAIEMARLEKEWEKQKDRWIFDRLVFGDDELTIVDKLATSKLVTQRSPGNVRIALGSRYRWVIGERKFDIDLEMVGGLSGITAAPLPESTADLADFVKGDWEALRAALIERVGPPTQSTPFPEAAQLRPGSLTPTDVWQQPHRTITIGVFEEGGRCQAMLRVSMPGAAK